MFVCVVGMKVSPEGSCVCGGHEGVPRRLVFVCVVGVRVSPEGSCVEGLLSM